MQKTARLRWASLGALGAGITALYLVLKFLLPLQLAAIDTRWTFWRAGVQSWRAGGLTGFQVDHCRVREGCQCIALVHGLGDDATTWKRILLRPESGWKFPVHLFAVNLPGTGETPPPTGAEGFRARKLGELVASSLRAQSGCEKWIVVGNSLGGWVSSWAALSWPEGIRKLVLVDSAGLKLHRTAEVGSLLGQASVESLKEFQAKAYYSPRPLPEYVWKAAARRAAVSRSREILEAQRPEDDLDTVLSGLKIPTLVLWGAADRIIPPERGRAMAQLIQGAQFREAPKCGHMPQKECPEVVAGVIQEMVRYGAM